MQRLALNIVTFLCIIPVIDAISLYVDAKTGSDSNPGTFSSPLASLSGAQQKWRALRQKAGPQPVEVVVNSNIELAASMELSGEADSGITITGSRWTGPKVAVSAGRRVTGWQRNKNASLWVAKVFLPPNVTGADLQFSVNGSAVQRARLPSAPGTFYQYSAPLVPCVNPKSFMPSCPSIDATGFVFKKGDIRADLHDLKRSVRFSVYHAWSRTVHSVKDLFVANSTVIFNEPSHYRFGSFPGPSGYRYVIENAREGLAPGGWYYDVATSTITYWPVSGNDAPPVNAVLGQLESAITITEGTHDVVLRNLALGHSTSHTLVVENAIRVRLCQLEVKHSQGHGVFIKNSTDVSLAHSRVWYVDQSGIWVGGGDAGADPSRNVLVSDNIVEWVGLGLGVSQPFGIKLGGTHNISAVHNEVRYTPYAGIGIGWQFGPETLPGPATVFEAAYNHVHHYGMGILSDFGGIYCSGLCKAGYNATEAFSERCSVNAVVRSNVIHDGRCFNYGAAGLYSDFDGARVTFEKNLVYDVDDEGIILHCGAANRATNNIVFGGEEKGSGTHSYFYGCDYHQANSFEFDHNVLYLDRAKDSVFVPYANYSNGTFNHNVYFTSANASLVFPTKPGAPGVAGSFAAWQAEGRDVGSRIIDPGFVDVAARDFAFRTDSPLPAIGIVPLDVKAAGPRRLPRRPTASRPPWPPTSQKPHL